MATFVREPADTAGSVGQKRRQAPFAAHESQLAHAAPAAAVDAERDIEDKIAMRRERNRLDAKRSRERRKFMTESLTTRMSALTDECRSLQQFVARRGLMDEWLAWAGPKETKRMPSSDVPPSRLRRLPPAPPSTTSAAAPLAASPGAAMSLLAAASAAAAGAGVEEETDGLVPLVNKNAVGLVPGLMVQLSAAEDGDGPLLLGPAGGGGSSLAAGKGTEQHPKQTELTAVDFALIECVTRCRRHFIVTDPKQPGNPIVFASQGFYDLTGYGPADTIGHNCRFLQGAGTDLRAVAYMRHHIAAGKDVRVILLNFTKGGVPFWNKIFVAPLRNSAGQVVHMVGVQSDMTSEAAQRELVAQHALVAAWEASGAGSDAGAGGAASVA